jgi:hypothetical protein
MNPEPDAASPPARSPEPALASPFTPRSPALDDSEIQPLGRRRAAPDAPLPPSPPNVRRSTQTTKLFSVLLLLIAALSFYAFQLYRNQIKPAIALIQANADLLAKSTSSSAGTSTPTSVPVARAVQVQFPPEIQQELAAAGAKIQELQQQIDLVRNLQTKHDAQVQKLIERIASSATTTASTPPLSTSDAAGVLTDAPQTSPFGSSDSASLAELRLLKERNRLSAYADEAISTGNRRPLDLIIEAMKDPDRATLFHAAKSEYYRVVGHFHLLYRIDPGYKLPVTELFSGGKVRDEADLKTDQIIALLENKDHDWQVRLRAAFLLGGRRTPEVGDALVKALLHDPNLDVAKEAQLSFEQNVGRNFMLFDLPGVESWWQTHTAVRSDPADKSSKPETAAPAAK